ncbi:MAG: hypothetical protein WCJ57_04865 [Candidatus Falkowbacteria bacterium]
MFDNGTEKGTSMNSNTHTMTTGINLNAETRTYRDTNKGILAGIIKPSCMSKVTLTNEQRPNGRPILRNHWACYRTGQDSVTEYSFHVDGIIIKEWEKGIDGHAFVKEVHDIGLDMNLAWARFETDVRAGRAFLTDDSSTFQLFLSKNQPNRNGMTIARRDGISLMVRWMRRQERFIVAQQERLMVELRAVGKAMGKSAFVGFADHEEELGEEAAMKREAAAAAVHQDAVYNALIKRTCRMSGAKVSEVLDCAPASLNVKQSSMTKLEGNHHAGVGNKGQIDSFRSAPRVRKQDAESILRGVAERQFARAEKALASHDYDEAEKLFQ